MHLSKHPFFLATGLCAALILTGNSARADGLADLKAALARLQGQTPLKAMVEVSTKNRSGEGKELEENSGHAAVSVEDGARGLQILYGKELLTKLESEEHAKEKDPKSKTPTLSALREFNSTELRPMISAAAGLARHMEKSIFKSEKVKDYNGKPARLLTFDIPLESIPEKDRKYIKKFEGSMDIWIGADGTPLASHTQITTSGRAFVVISFEAKNEEQTVYGVSGDRLITVRKESKSSGSGAGEKGESQVTKTLQLQS